MKGVAYALKVAPLEYVCSVCKAPGCKLWRQYQTFAKHIELLCIDCAVKDQGKELVEATPLGKVKFKRADGHDVGSSDQIGWLVPAVPCENDGTFWGYTSVPIEGCVWWKNLPLRAGDAWNDVCSRCAGGGWVMTPNKRDVVKCPACTKEAA